MISALSILPGMLFSHIKNFSCSLISFWSLLKVFFSVSPALSLSYLNMSLSWRNLSTISPSLLHFPPTMFILPDIVYFLFSISSENKDLFSCFANCLAHSWYTTILSVWMFIMHLYFLPHLTGASFMGIWACVFDKDETDRMEALSTHSDYGIYLCKGAQSRVGFLEV